MDNFSFCDCSSPFQKILPLDKSINQQEGVLAYKVINGTYWLGDILTDRHGLDHYQLRNY